MPELTHLIDNSAFNRLAHQAVRDRIVPLLEAAKLGTCGVIELEALYSARSPAEYEEQWDRRGAALVYVEMNDDSVQEALAIQRRLAARSQVRGAKIPDLLIAGVAKRHGLTVLHYDSDFDRIGQVGEVDTEWVVPRGSVP